MKCKVIGIGETVLDILFRNQQPIVANPGGSCFNSMISVGRTGLPCAFVGYAGDDAVGKQTLDFLKANGVSVDSFRLRSDMKSALSLAYLDEKGDADYVFYKFEHPVLKDWKLPEVAEEDVVLLGSYFAICPGVRSVIENLLAEARSRGALVYYDLNYRKTHRDEMDVLYPSILWNFRHSSIVRGSADDFAIMYGLRDAREVYRNYIAPYCPVFLCTSGADVITLCTPSVTYEFPVPVVPDVVSTVGAGDNFNAGMIYGMVKQGIRPSELATLPLETWTSLIQQACSFAREACRSTNNYISRDFVNRLE